MVSWDYFKMVTTLLFDFSRVILDIRDKTYKGFLNDLHREKSKQPGYNFFDYFELNEELLHFLETIKDRYSLYIFTTGSVQNVPEVRKRIDPVFGKIYSSEELDLNKEDSRSYLFIAKELDKEPSEILFTDDKLANIKSAEAAGLITIHFQSTEQFINELSKIVII